MAVNCPICGEVLPLDVVDKKCPHCSRPVRYDFFYWPAVGNGKCPNCEGRIYYVSSLGKDFNCPLCKIPLHAVSWY